MSSLFSQWNSLEKNSTDCNFLSIGSSFGVKDGFVFTTFSYRSSSDIAMCRALACCQSLYECICVPTLLCLEGFDFLVSSIFYGTYIPFVSSSTEFPEPWHEKFKSEYFKVFQSEHLLTVGLCIPSYLLQQEASLMMVE